MKYNLLFIFFLVFTVNCFAQKGRWNKTLQMNTIEGYQKFIENYPNSKYLDNARLKINELEDKEKKRLSKIDLQYQRLSQYKVGELTESQFISDGWKAKDVWLGVIGIVEFEKISNRTIIVLGICDINNEHKAKDAEENDYMIKIARFAGISSDVNIKQVHRNSQGEDITRYFCKLTFLNNLLSQKKCDF